MSFNKLKSIRHNKKGLGSGMALILIVIVVIVIMYLSTVFNIPYISDFTTEVIDTFDESFTNEAVPPVILLDLQFVQTSTGIIQPAQQLRDYNIFGTGDLSIWGWDIDPEDIDNYHFLISTNAPRIVSGNPYQIILSTVTVEVASEDTEHDAIFNVIINDGNGDKFYQYIPEIEHFIFEGVLDNWTFIKAELYSPTGLKIVTHYGTLE